jgi:Tol biopolymer transport system component
MRHTSILSIFRRSAFLILALGLLIFPALIRAQLLASSDLSRLRSIGSVTLSPDGHYLAYTIVMRDRPGRPYDQLWVMDLATEKSVRLASDKPASAPLWSPDSHWLAFRSADGNHSGLWIAHPDASDTTYLATVASTNSPLPGMGKKVAWSPDSKQIAFISSTPGEPTESLNDPIVITRYLYKPDAGEGLTRFNDNQRLHLFLVDLASKQVRQLTQGNFDEHSIDWSPDGKQLLFASNRETNQDEFFNYDLFTFQLADNSIHRLTATES